MTTTFDPATFLNQQFEGTLDTKMVPCPAGETIGMIDKSEIVPWASRDGTKSGVKAQLLWSVEDDAIKSLLGRDKVIVRQDIMLDTTEDGSLDMGKGKNIRLGRLLEALDLNNGEPWSFGSLVGRMAKINVSHRPSQDGQDVYAEVDRVAHA